MPRPVDNQDLAITTCMLGDSDRDDLNENILIWSIHLVRYDDIDSEDKGGVLTLSSDPNPTNPNPDALSSNPNCNRNVSRNL